MFFGVALISLTPFQNCTSFVWTHFASVESVCFRFDFDTCCLPFQNKRSHLNIKRLTVVEKSSDEIGYHVNRKRVTKYQHDRSKVSIETEKLFPGRKWACKHYEKWNENGKEMKKKEHFKGKISPICCHQHTIIRSRRNEFVLLFFNRFYYWRWHIISSYCMALNYLHHMNIVNCELAVFYLPRCNFVIPLSSKFSYFTWIHLVGPFMCIQRSIHI